MCFGYNVYTYADHEMNCSTAAMRHIGSSKFDPYSAVAGSAAGTWKVFKLTLFYLITSLALYGPLHGGANEAAFGHVNPNRKRLKMSQNSLKVSKIRKRADGFGP